jgi:predicted metal-dependent hydrolase
LASILIHISGDVFFLSLVADQSTDLKLNQGRFCLKRSLINQGGEAAAKKTFEHFYRTKGESRIKNRVAYYAPKVGVHPSGLRVKDLGYRWASCTRNKMVEEIRRWSGFIILIGNEKKR